MVETISLTYSFSNVSVRSALIRIAAIEVGYRVDVGLRAALLLLHALCIAGTWEQLPRLGVDGVRQHVRLAHVGPFHNRPARRPPGWPVSWAMALFSLREGELHAVDPHAGDGDGDLRVDQRLQNMFEFRHASPLVHEPHQVFQC